MKGQLSANLIAIMSLLVTALLGVVTVRAVFEINDRGPTPQRSLQATYLGPFSPLDDLGKTPDIAIKVMSNGVELKNVVVIQTILRNNGKSPILPSDIFDPLSISVKPPWKIVTVVNGQPEAAAIIKFKWSRVDDQTFSSSPALLNPGDIVWANAYLTNKESNGKVDSKFPKPESILSWSGRVSNVKSITMDTDGGSKTLDGEFYVMMWDWGVVFFVCSFVLYFTFYFLLLSRFSLFSPIRIHSIVIFMTVTIISFCASDAGTTYVFGTIFGKTSHLMNAPILIINGLILAGMGYYTWRRRNLPSEI